MCFVMGVHCAQGNPEDGNSVRLSGHGGLPCGEEAKVKHERGQELAWKDIAGGWHRKCSRS